MSPRKAPQRGLGVELMSMQESVGSQICNWVFPNVGLCRPGFSAVDGFQVIARSFLHAAPHTHTQRVHARCEESWLECQPVKVATGRASPGLAGSTLVTTGRCFSLQKGSTCVNAPQTTEAAQSMGQEWCPGKSPAGSVLPLPVLLNGTATLSS